MSIAARRRFRFSFVNCCRLAEQAIHKGVGVDMSVPGRSPIGGHDQGPAAMDGCRTEAPLPLPTSGRQRRHHVDACRPRPVATDPCWPCPCIRHQTAEYCARSDQQVPDPPRCRPWNLPVRQAISLVWYRHAVHGPRRLGCTIPFTPSRVRIRPGLGKLSLGSVAARSAVAATATRIPRV